MRLLVERFQERRDNSRIEMSASLPFNHATCVRSAARLSVRAIRREHVIGVGDRDNPSLDGYGFTDQAVWIAAAIHALVVIEHSEELTLEVPSPPQDAHANFRVSFHHLPFRSVQRTVLVQDRIGDAELADVVEEAGAGKSSLLGCFHAQFPADLDAELGDPAIVSLGLTVLDLDCRHQGGDNLNIELFVID